MSALVARKRKVAFVAPVFACKWCGELPLFTGFFVNLESGEVIIAYACEDHSENLTSLIDGLADGALTEAYKSQRQVREMN